MHSTLEAPRRLKTMRKRYVIGAIVLLLGGAVLAPLVYFFSWRDDVPFRIAGRYEKDQGRVDEFFSVSPISKRIVYSTTTTGHGDLWSIDQKGQNGKQLTTDPEYEAAPCFSPDGSKIVFSRETGKCGHIWLMNADGTGAIQLTSGPDYDDSPIFSPDGQHIWFQRIPPGTKRDIRAFTMTSTGKDIRPLGVNVGDGDEASFAPNGQWVYVIRMFDRIVNSAEIWRMKPDGSQSQDLVQGRNPVVSPDSKEVAYVPGNAWEELWIMHLDGSQKRLVYRSNSVKWHVAFAPDGKSLFFSEEAANMNLSISSVKLDGSAYHQLKEVMP